MSPNSREWNIIAQRNYLDMALYAYIEKLFDEYDGIFNLFPQDVEDDEDIVEESAALQETSDVVAGSSGSVEEETRPQESAEEIEARIIKDSPYDGPNDEDAAVEAAESNALQSNSTDPKAGLKRRLADVSSFEFGSDKAAIPFFWHVPKASCYFFLLYHSLKS